MRRPVSTFALAVLLAFPTLAPAQDKEARPTVDVPGGAEISDRDLAPIAEAIRRGEPASRIDTNWKALLERQGEALREANPHALTLRVLHAAWEPGTADLDRTARELEASDRCTDEGAAIERERGAIERAFATGEDASEADVRTAREALAGLAEAMDACRAALEREREAAEKEALAEKRAERPAIRPVAGEPEKRAEGEAPAAEEEAEAGAPAVSQFADELAAAGDDAPAPGMPIQDGFDEQARAFQSLSSLARTAHDTAMSIIQNMR